MKLKIIIGGIVVIAAIIFGALSFVESNVEYTSFLKAKSVGKKVQVKGSWVKEGETFFNAQRGEFTFSMVDEDGTEEKVTFTGAKPNNFEIADAIVVKGRFEDGNFRATEILTKCPSKYNTPAGQSKTAD
jgi:cytochrome c-type biogenesis protein CcmE